MRRQRTKVFSGTATAVASLALVAACSFSSAGGGGGTGGDDSSETDAASGGATEGIGTTDDGATGPGATTSATGSTGAATTAGTTTSDATTGVASTSSSTEPETTGCAAVLWYPDGDGDGYGAGEPLESCEQPDGHVDAPGDCDDDNDAISPGIDELCDEQDNNCNNLVDEWSPANADCHGCALATYDDRFYAFCKFDRDWGDAREECMWRGGDLAISSDQAENDFVFVEAFKVDPGGWWLGSRRQSGNWVWVDGQNVNDGYENWAPGEPSGIAGDAMALKDMGAWWSEDDFWGRRFICEITPP